MVPVSMSGDRPGKQEPTMRARASQTIRRSVVSLVSYALYLPVSLVVARVAVDRIGLTAYGIWAALTAIVGYGGLLDLGISVSMVKYVSEYLAQNRHADINRLVSTSL